MARQMGDGVRSQIRPRERSIRRGSPHEGAEDGEGSGHGIAPIPESVEVRDTDDTSEEGRREQFEREDEGDSNDD